MLTAIRARIADHKARSAARDAYFTADREAGNHLRSLRGSTDPRERAKSYMKAAEAALTMSRVHRRAFGPTPNGDGGDLADSALYESMLLRCLGDVEHVAACNGQVGRNYRFPELGEPADEVLDRMAAAGDLTERVALLDDLYDAVVDRIGGQAAEVLANIA